MVMKRRSFSVRISEDAYAAMVAFANRHGVTLTGLVEAMGERLAELLDDDEISEQARALVNRAREIDQRHRSRRSEG